MISSSSRRRQRRRRRARADRSTKPGVPELAGRHVHAEVAQRASPAARATSPAWASASRSTQPPIGTIEAGLLGDSMKSARRQQAADRVLPADQRLEADVAPVGRSTIGWYYQLEGAGRRPPGAGRDAQSPAARTIAACAGRHGTAASALAVALGQVEGQVGVAQQVAARWPASGWWPRRRSPSAHRRRRGRRAGRTGGRAPLGDLLDASAGCRRVLDQQPRTRRRPAGRRCRPAAAPRSAGRPPGPAARRRRRARGCR